MTDLGISRFVGKRLNLAAIPLIGTLCTTTEVLAECRMSDRWFGDDKRLHFVGGAGVAAATPAYTGDAWNGFYVGSAVGVAKKIIVRMSGAGCEPRGQAFESLWARHTSNGLDRVGLASFSLPA